jgi:succinate dehydrogenase/fumarate reductase flavoprotein subunit
LGVKDDLVVFLDGVPDEVDLGDLGAAHVVRRLPECIDVAVTFHQSYAALKRRLPVLVERTSTTGMVWVCWPKKSAQKARGLVSDLDDSVVRALGLELGFVDVKVAAIDETWSGLKFVRRVKDR